MSYEHIFFDLDHTIWDFKSNSREALLDIYNIYDLANKGIKSPWEFIAEYERINESLWTLYRQQLISKKNLRNTRFNRVFQHWQIVDDQLSFEANEMYLNTSPYKTGLMPGALDALKYLSGKYELHLITNGFKEVQGIKIDRCGIREYFDKIIISEDVGVQKPHPKIFEHALNEVGTSAAGSIYIGDHPDSDIKGSKNAGWDQVFYNPENIDSEVEATFEINHHDELLEIF
jgi:putative hydrolase of the HAD superfamily